MDKVTYTGILFPNEFSSNKCHRQQESGKSTWSATICMCHHKLLLGKLSIVNVNLLGKKTRRFYVDYPWTLAHVTSLIAF